MPNDLLLFETVHGATADVTTMKYIGDIFREARRERGWNPQECARAAGYENADKGANRLIAIERGRDRFPDERVWRRFAEALDIPVDDIEQTIADAVQAEYDRLASIHCEPQLIVKPFAGFYYQQEVPEGLTDQELIDYAKALAADMGVKTCVVFSPVECVYVKPSGDTYRGTRAPYMTLK